ncbi:MAG TPA: RNA polymerase sigma factor [Actinomycetota bacterium]|jgi:RNA polymerase sigma-70 factor (ECF subfamily)
MGGRPLEDEELVERARNGDVTAYEQLVRMYQDVAARTAYVITGGAADAQDAAQEAFVKAYYSLSRFRAGAAFRPWLLRIVANEAINRRRSTRRQVGLALRAAEGRLQDDAVPSPEGAALAQDDRRRLVAAMNRLRPEDRLVIAYRYWFELSEAEMAEALGCARGTVKSRLSRALGRLREVMAPAGLGGDRVGLEGAADG